MNSSTTVRRLTSGASFSSIAAYVAFLLASTFYISLLFSDAIPAIESLKEGLLGEEYEQANSTTYILRQLPHEPVGTVVMLAAKYRDAVLFMHLSILVMVGVLAQRASVRNRILVLLGVGIVALVFRALIASKFGGGLIGPVS